MDNKRLKTQPMSLSQYFTVNPTFDEQHPHFQNTLPSAIQTTINRAGSGNIIGMFISMHSSRTPLYEFKEHEVVEIAECTTGVAIRIIPNEKVLEEMKRTLKPFQILCINGHFLSCSKVDKFGLCFDATKCQEFQTNVTHPDVFNKYQRQDDFLISDLSSMSVPAKRLISCKCQIITVKGRSAHVSVHGLENQDIPLFFFPKDSAEQIPPLEIGTMYIVKYVFISTQKDEKHEGDIVLTYTIGVSSFEIDNSVDETRIDPNNL